ncbi:class I SAM-dependent methyltransferase [Couchioplanes azureus]|uniref:class I SAM-dependent methyltransferase n=1 Tax=Couchioplanes caeruleus TaxID=56438 RepID=UPI00167188E5|nr:class I SAM-dependent methyltransferase [Couchioplanes caeruleus]GGQ77078.1 hypothetical protein GCM10010166_53780 [Couchioplanes caeruleus subsp. azureus]
MRAAMDGMQYLFDHHGHGYDRFTRAVFGRLHARVLADAAAAAPTGGVVLDVGAGPGRLAVALAASRPDLTVLAVDVSPSMVEVANRRAANAGLGQRVRVDRADVAALPLDDASVDLVVSSVSFHHWTDVPGAVREMRRVIRPTGRIWIYDARIAPWRRLAAAAYGSLPRTSAGLLFTRAEVPAAAGVR